MSPTRRLHLWCACAAVSVALACRASAPQDGQASRTTASGEQSPQLVELIGFLNVVVGDGATLSGTPSLFVSIALQSGRSVSLLADSAHASVLAGAISYRTRVKATGRYLSGDTTQLWIERLDSVPEAGRR